MNYDLFGKIAVGWIVGWFFAWVIFLLWPGSVDRRPVLRLVYSHMQLVVFGMVVIIVVPLAIGDFFMKDLMLAQSREEHEALKRAFEEFAEAIKDNNGRRIWDVLDTDTQRQIEETVSALKAQYEKASEEDR